MNSSPCFILRFPSLVMALYIFHSAKCSMYMHWSLQSESVSALFVPQYAVQMWFSAKGILVMLFITMQNMPVNQLYLAMEHEQVLSDICTNTASRIFVSSSDLWPFFSATLQNVVYTCLYSPSPSWALNCRADWWLGKRWGTSGCIRMQNIAVTASVRVICMCSSARVCVRIEPRLFWKPPHHKESTLRCCLCRVVSLRMFTLALCFFVSAALLLPRLARLCLAQFLLWCNTLLLQH